MRRKLLSATLVASLFSIPMYSVDFWGSTEKRGTMNQTEAGSWKDPSSGLTYHSGGNLSFKFKRGARNFPPVGKIRGPSAKASCSGFSLDAGFVALIGGDEFKQMISDAGQAAAFGLVLALVGTMPNIADTFNKLNEWIRKLQELMQNACERTEEWAKSKGVNGPMDTYVWGNVQRASDFSAEELKDKVVKKLKEKYGGSKEENEKQAGKDLAQLQQSEIMNGIGIFSKIVSGTIFNSSDAKDKILYKRSTLHEIIKENKYKLTNEQLIAAETLFLFFGDYAFDSRTNQIIVSFYQDIGDVLDTTMVQEKIKHALLSTESGEENKAEKRFTVVEIQPVETDPLEIASHLLYGFNKKDSDNPESEVKGKLSYPNYQVLLFAAPLDSPTNESGSTSTDGTMTASDDGKLWLKGVYLMDQVAYQGDEEIETEWEGVYNLSYKSITNYVKSGIKGQKISLDYVFDSSIHGYAEVLIYNEQAAKKRSGDDSDLLSARTMQLIELLAKQNSSEFVVHLVKNIENHISDNISTAGASASQEALTRAASKKAALNRINLEVQNWLRSHTAERLKNAEELSGFFEKILEVEKEKITDQITDKVAK